jgi:uncharacterized protein involved in copper resistance
VKTLVVVSLGLVFGCAHAREAEDPSRAAAAEAEAEAEPQPGSDGEAEAEAPAQSAEKGPAQKEGRVSGGDEDPGEIPVASSPGGLLKPGAEQKVRD